MKFGLSSQVIQKIKGVFSSHPEVEAVILYGSRAMGNFKAGSDVDLTSFFAESPFSGLCANTNCAVKPK